ncbi:YjbE family integral membrane protein [Anoxybacillus voinovskiensis]|uniref:YjbE family integral membrane protein n=1 Tax=Anoxybacteroides voinovskiense TaxID=230470 RepID=A0A840DY30_9BACL|nr:TerC family protein [Anoxybacillus voinovskiensis]MBB4074429.1 YjbE family integral membrane protein [Anoxybacillus voinovskiensis]GGJ69926.1 membrane protein [Anoxybacillus voinovskiensis]
MISEYVTSILLIIGIDLVLGGDNAVVIAMASRNLPEHKRNTAIVLGTTLAIIVRILLTATVVVLLKVPFLQFAGGCLLLWISFKLLVQKENAPAHIKSETSLWKAVQTIVVADVVMGLDNVVAIAGAANGHPSLVVFGFLVSVPIIILGSKFILYSMERYPFLLYIGAALLAYTAGKMLTAEERMQFLYDNIPLVRSFLPFLTALLIVLFGGVAKKRHRFT